MPITCTSEDRLITDQNTGEVDHHSAKSMMEELDRQMELVMPRRLTVDLSGVTFMDSSGIAVLLRAWKRVGELSGEMSVTGVPDQPGKVLRAAGVDRLIPYR